MTFHASEQVREDVQEKLFEYLEEIKEFDPSRLVFVDESSAHYHLVRTHGRAEKGKRAYGRKPNHRGKRMSMIGALGYDGLRSGMFWDGYVDGCAFEIFLDEYLIPSLHPGGVVVWDNFSAHKRWDFEKKINEADAFLVFLPPYSPELSPIEECWSKIKSMMRKFAATSADGLWEAFCVGFDAVTGVDAKGWFHHCGYIPTFE